MDAGDYGIVLGALGLVSGIASAAYARGQVVAARAQLKDAREQAVDALRAAELVADTARRQADAALRAAELLAVADISARVRAMRASNLASNPKLPPELQALVERAGGSRAYTVLQDAIEAAQEIYFLRKRGVVSAEQWRGWMLDDVALVAGNLAFEEAFRRAAKQDELAPEFVVAFEAVLRGRDMADPAALDPGPK